MSDYTDGFDIGWNPDTDIVKWKGRDFVVNDNYRFLAWYSGWKQGKNNRIFIHRYTHPEHKKLEWQGFNDAKYDPYGRSIND